MRIESVLAMAVIDLLMTIPLCRRIEGNQFVTAQPSDLLGEGKEIGVQQKACFDIEPLFSYWIDPKAKIDSFAETLQFVCQAGHIARLQIIQTIG